MSATHDEYTDAAGPATGGAMTYNEFTDAVAQRARAAGPVNDDG
jgi:hypothetical protein